ncbi:MAG: dTDP-4-dehydrorhamnose 3,5-epimerase [Phycisphaerales bacterium]|jgi:dTDP-4-dehydrorhamnose 3,5-epimerase|nr:dTDP-4-dehydrorhamnose 3,5-epimerase [Phycisphaerales bacterium]
MKRIDTDLPGVCLLEPDVFGDQRGFFMETYNQRVFEQIGITQTFVQDNQSRSRRGVLRGLHYQLNQPQAKLVRVTLGEVYDIAVDLRRGSETFGKWTGVTLTAENKQMFFIPEGFAHGFCVISETAEFAYKCSDFYAPEEERGIIWNDPQLAIPWPLDGAEPILSPKDAAYGILADMNENDLPILRENSDA